MSDKTNQFLQDVLPWPGPSDPGYVNLHWLIPSPYKPGDHLWVGKPTRELSEFNRLTSWAIAQAGTTDIYMCMSRQAKCGASKKNKPKAIRSAADATHLKAIWLDVDVKADPKKGYPNLGAALDAVLDFVKKNGLPPPSSLVASGGGLHVYWISKLVLTNSDWQSYANGLKSLALMHGLLCDAGVTSDSARVLRVPDTWNYKDGKQRPVKVLHHGVLYDFPTDLAFLTTIAPAPVGALATVPATAPPAFDLSGFPKRNETVESLAEGLGYEETLVDPFPIFKQCGFFQTALLTGGKDYNNPLWIYTILGSVFMEGGNGLAHKMAKGHATYRFEETEAKWDLKRSDRKGGVGWPSCNAIASAGCTACATCPLKGKIKSPLSIGSAVAPASPPVAITAPVSAAALRLPDGYTVNSKGHICVTVREKVKDQPDLIEDRELFWCVVSNVRAQSSPDALLFTVTSDLGNTRAVVIPMKDMSGFRLYDKLLENGVKPCPANKKFLEDFIMAWMTKLHDAEKSTTATPYGWYVENGERHGFVFGGLIMRDAGRSDIPAGTGDQEIRKVYTPVGSKSAWMTACNMVCAEKRPNVQMIMAAAFASPLMASTGQYSCMLSAFGPDSGSGKSTALEIGVAVWAHPKLAKEAGFSTARSIIHKMGEIKHLPMYRDELTEAKQFEQTFDHLFMASNGVDGSRLKSDITHRPRGEWQNMSVICSNMSFVNFVANKQKTTPAGVYRVFEVTLPKPDPTDLGRINWLDASRINAELSNNHGMMGLDYARLLANDPKGVDDLVKKTIDDLCTECTLVAEERFWGSLCGTILAGATLANRLGCSFDVELMHAYIVERLADMRRAIKDEARVGGSLRETEEVMTAFFRAHADRALWTRTAPLQKVGRPSPIEVLKWPQHEGKGGIVVQWVVGSRLLLISLQVLNQYLVKEDIPPRQVTEGLAKHFGAKIYERLTLGRGTPWRTNKERLVIIDVPAGSTFADMLEAHTRPEDIGAAKAQQESVNDTA